MCSLASYMKNRTLTLTILLITACSGGRGDDVLMKEAARVHNETMALAVLVEEAINNGEADSTNTISNDSIVYWRQLFEAWERDVVEVPGNEAHHTHAGGSHHHDHTPPDVTAEQMLEIQKTLAKRMSDLSRRVHP
jgi:hypothetical protein